LFFRFLIGFDREFFHIKHTIYVNITIPPHAPIRTDAMISVLFVLELEVEVVFFPFSLLLRSNGHISRLGHKKEEKIPPEEVQDDSVYPFKQIGPSKQQLPIGQSVLSVQ
jgi:hypothetical protein